MSVIDKINQYLENIDKCRQIGTNRNYTLLTDDDIINVVKKDASDRFDILKENNKILKDIIYDVDIKSINSDYIKDLEYFASKVFDYSASIDSAIYLEINKKLLEYAKYINKDELIIKYSYAVSLGLYYLNGSSQSVSLQNKLKVGEILKEVCEKYFPNFDNYDETTRFYLIRCYGNIKLGLPKDSEENIKKHLNIANKLIKYCNNEEFRNNNPHIPYDNLIYSTYFDILSSINYLRGKKVEEYNDFEKTLAKTYLASIEYIEQKAKINQIDENRIQNWRLQYYSLIVRYHNGLTSLSNVLEFLISKCEATDCFDVSPDGIRKNVVYCVFLLDYYKDASEDIKEKYHEKVDKITHKVLKYVEILRKRNYPQLINYVFSILAIIQTYSNKYDYISIIDHFLFNHRPTYIHSYMVASLSKYILSYTIQHKPELLVGVLDTKTVKDVLTHKDEMIDTIFQGSVYHDIGKTIVISYISNYERSLTDDEFNCVKYHTTCGHDILKSVGLDDLATIALYHHKFYDGTKGYPENANLCPKRLKVLVDIVSIADSLDAASDFIGRSYKNYKKLEEICEEFRTFSGTRYNKDIVELFNDSEFFNKIRHILNEDRKQLYINTYKGNKFNQNSHLD